MVSLRAGADACVMLLRAATRGSPLALWQTACVARLLSDAAPGGLEAGEGQSTPVGEALPAPPVSRRPAPDSRQRIAVRPVVVATTGDRRAGTPISEMGGKGVFAKEVQAAVLDGRADIAVHSAKDLPSTTPPGLALACVPARGDPRDALVGCRLADLPEGAVVATGSARRRVQLAWHRPDLSFVELRGNIDTRLERTADCHAVVMAAAALERLRIHPEVLDVLEREVMVPQAGQGAIAVECRADDHAALAALAAVEHRQTRRAVDAERAFLAQLGGDCSLPAGAHAAPAASDGGAGRELALTGLLASPDGRVVLKEALLGADPVALGRAVARRLLDRPEGRALAAALDRDAASVRDAANSA